MPVLETEDVGSDKRDTFRCLVSQETDFQLLSIGLVVFDLNSGATNLL